MRLLNRFAVVSVLIAITVGALTAVSCGPAPITQIYVTATPMPQATFLVTAPATTETPTQGAATWVGPLITGEGGVLVTITPGGPTATWIGPVLGVPTPSPLPTVPVTAAPPTEVVPTQVPPVESPPGPSPTPLPALRADFMGIQIHPGIEREMLVDLLNMVKFDLRMRWIKYQVDWSQLQEPDGSYNINFQRLEDYIQAAHNEDFEVFISVVNAPMWARPAGSEGPNGPPADYSLYANFVAYLAEHFVNRVDAIEIWNEPNLSIDWTGAPISGAEYMRLLRLSYEAIKAVNPNMIVVSAGLGPTGGSMAPDGSIVAMDDREFLRQMYDAGLASYSDAVGVHPYGWGNPPLSRCCDPFPDRGWDEHPSFFFLNTIEDYRAIMEQYGDGAKPIWITEFGWPTYEGFGVPAPEPFFDYVSEWDQANYIMEAFAWGQSQPYIQRMFLWNLNFAIFQGPNGQQAGYAILRPDGTPRPAYQLLRESPRQ